MRRVPVLVLVACAAAAAALALGAAGAPGPAAPQAATAHAAGAHAAAPTVASLKATIRRLLPATRCDAGAAKRGRALKLRTAALKNIAKQPPRELRKRKATLKRAIALLRQAGTACAAPPAPGGGTPAPGTPAPPAPQPPGPAPGPTVITLHVTGNTLDYVEPSATAPAGQIRIDLVNGSNFNHFAGVRVASGQPTIGESPLSSPGETVSVTVTLAPGTYQVFCRNNNHDVIGPMVMPLTVT